MSRRDLTMSERCERTFNPNWKDPRDAEEPRASAPAAPTESDAETLAVLLDNVVIAQSLSRELRERAHDEARSYLYNRRQKINAAIAKATGSECERCNGRGEIGGPVGQTAETFEWVTEPCPDCAKATGEAGT